MKCLHCKKESDALSRVCPYCGQYMGEEAPAPVPLGEAVPVYDDRDYQRPQRRPGKQPAQPKRRKRRRAKQAGRKNSYRRVMVNWAMVGMVAALLLLVAVLGSYVYLKVTPGGQLILARMGRDASADAYWTLGTEYLDQGYVGRSITTYEHALALQPEHPQLVDKLMLLAEAYEAGSRPRDAEAVYTRIYDDLKPEDPIGYRNAIRLMLQEDRENEAVALMSKAEEKTGDLSFANQRASMVPLPPTATVSAGRYLISKTVAFVSPQGYDIFYATGNEELPEQGTRYEGPITLGEGTHVFRAVCMSQDLMSDEMSVRYVVTLPQPPAPKANLAAKEYTGSRSVSLRDMEDDKTDPRKVSQLYYTIDGTPPSADSPRFTGEPIKLPTGRVLLRAIAINGYGKVSNELNVQYTIKNGTPKKYFNATDEFKGMPLMKTSYEAFTAKYGEPQRTEEIQDDAVTGITSRALYQWGEARFVVMDVGNMLYTLTTTDPSMTGPRGSHAGEDMESVTARFRDMGQLPNDRGDRGIYFNIADGYANYQAESDDPTTGTLRYVATLFDETAYTHLLTYDIQAGKVHAITMRHVARKISNVQ